MIYTHIKDIFHNNVVFYLNIAGGILIGLSFIFIGIVCLLYADKAAVEPGAKMRKLFTQMTGAFLMSCGISRGVDVVCYWYDLLLLAGILKLFTGVISLITLFYVPGIIKAISNVKILDEVNNQLKETRTKVEILQKTTEILARREDK